MGRMPDGPRPKETFPWNQCMAYLYLLVVDFYGKSVGKYTVRLMDPMGFACFCCFEAQVLFFFCPNSLAGER